MAIRHIKIGSNDAVDIHDARIEAIDDELDTESTNPIENAAVATAIETANGSITTLGSLLSTLSATVSNLSSNEAEIAWDGASTPVVANIPAGVEVEYNSTTYTGTLTASASTLGTTYYVAGDNGDWNRYVTVKEGNNYVWFDLGGTDIDLSDYERKDDNVWLTEDEWEALTIKDPNKTYNIYEESDNL